MRVLVFLISMSFSSAFAGESLCRSVASEIMSECFIDQQHSRGSQRDLLRCYEDSIEGRNDELVSPYYLYVSEGPYDRVEVVCGELDR